MQQYKRLYKYSVEAVVAISYLKSICYLMLVTRWRLNRSRHVLLCDNNQHYFMTKSPVQYLFLIAFSFVIVNLASERDSSLAWSSEYYIVVSSSLATSLISYILSCWWWCCCRTAMKKLGEALSDRELEDMMRQADIDGDGRINYEGKIRDTCKIS